MRSKCSRVALVCAAVVGVTRLLRELVLTGFSFKLARCDVVTGRELSARLARWEHADAGFVAGKGQYVETVL